MSIHRLIEPKYLPNEFGETPLPFAPKVQFGDGQSVVPQQYLDVVRSVDNLENILACVEFSDEYLFFAGQIESVLYLQVGVIGRENYPTKEAHHQEIKIVYGRRWLIEPTTPTSEVIQTAMLAVKKAREHECREKVFKFINDGQNRTTPYNSHIDLPLMSTSPNLLKSENRTLEQQVENLVASVKLNTLSLSVKAIHAIDPGNSLVVLNITGSAQNEPVFPELANQNLSLMCNPLSNTDLAHELISEVIKHSDRFVEEHFKFNNFSRFSRDLNIDQLATLSLQSRGIENTDKRFDKHFEKMSYDVDAAKAPRFANGELGERQRTRLMQAGVNGGHYPLEPANTKTMRNAHLTEAYSAEVRLP